MAPAKSLGARVLRKRGARGLSLPIGRCHSTSRTKDAYGDASGDVPSEQLGGPCLACVRGVGQEVARSRHSERRYQQSAVEEVATRGVAKGRTAAPRRGERRRTSTRRSWR